MALVRSLRARVVLWVSVALIVLFAVTIVGLDIAFRRSIDRALLELLEAHVVGLIAAAESGPGGELDDADRQPRSRSSRSRTRGCSARCSTRNGRAIWQSLSLIGRDFPADELPEPGKKHYAKLDVPGFPPLEALLMGIGVGVRGQPHRAVHVRDRGLARAVQATAVGVPARARRVVRRNHAHDARRDRRAAHVRAAAAAPARAPGPRGRGRRAREA